MRQQTRTTNSPTTMTTTTAALADGKRDNLRARDERVSLAPLTPEQALRGLLGTPPTKD
jgi:hypothetical protein